MSKPRTIFEEVGGSQRAAAQPPARPGEADRRKRRARRVTAWWLLALAALVVASLLAGGVGRFVAQASGVDAQQLTLSLMPPLNAAEQRAAFALFTVESGAEAQDFAEYRARYAWAWSARALGWAFTLVWALGLAALLALRMAPRAQLAALAAPGLLGAAGLGAAALTPGMGGAGARAAVELGLGGVVLALALWPAWRLLHDEVALLQARRRRAGAAMTAFGVVLALGVAVLALGGLVTGAGGARALWPDFASLDLASLPGALLSDHAWIEAARQLLGYALALGALGAFALAWRTRLGPVRRWGAVALALACGLAGLATAFGLPAPHFALAHLAGALALLAALLRARFMAAYPPERSALRG